MFAISVSFRHSALFESWNVLFFRNSSGLYENLAIASGELGREALVEWLQQNITAS
jgi:hypothetical protein